MVGAFALGGLAAAFAWLAPAFSSREAAAPTHPVFTEVAWPFPVDEWGKGKAYRCSAGDCGTEVNLYVRAKIGFCNCTTGVSDDDELDRLSDFNLMGKDLAVQGDGHPINVHWMKGRSRAYALNGTYRRGQSALAVAFNDRCDAIVATVIVGHNRPALVEPAALGFLNGPAILRWAEVTLGL